MNITIVQGGFLPVPPVAGGAVEKLWFDLGREFARRGLAVTHISRLWPDLPRSDLTDGVAHRRVGGFDSPRSRLLAKAMDLAYSLRCLFGQSRAFRHADVIVTNTFFLPLLLPLLLPRFLPPFTRRGVVYVSVHRYPQGQMRLYGRVDRLQCVSTAIADAVRAQAPAVGRLVKVVPNYVSVRLAEAEAEAGWAARRREVLFVGRVHPEKGIDLLMRAFAGIAAERRAGWSLRIVGPHETAAGGGGGAFLEALKREAAALGLPVEWAGPIYDREALNEAYRRSRVFVYPSVAAQGEAFPLAPLEAMAQGCPVVTSDLACFSDYVRPGHNAESFALGAADVPADLGRTLDSLMHDEPRQRRHSLAGLQTAQQFMLARVADAFIDDFTALLQRKAAAPAPSAKEAA
jgi:glycosyltransferase involved in cell wall biosynthesis